MQIQSHKSTTKTQSVLFICWLFTYILASILVYSSLCNQFLAYLVGPRIIGLMNRAENEGNSTSFTCQANGEPLPTISWYFNGLALDDSNTAKYTIIERPLPDANKSVLIIMELESSDVGTYTCYATNVISNDTSYGVLTVNGQSCLICIATYVCMLLFLQLS